MVKSPTTPSPLGSNVGSPLPGVRLEDEGECKMGFAVRIEVIWAGIWGAGTAVGIRGMSRSGNWRERRNHPQCRRCSRQPITAE
jgi:hypothetical protein